MSQRGALTEAAYLKTLRITVAPEAVRRAVGMLEGGTSLFAIYKDDKAVNHVSKVTAEKIRNRWKEGKLKDFGSAAESSVVKDDVQAKAVAAQRGPTTQFKNGEAEVSEEFAEEFNVPTKPGFAVAGGRPMPPPVSLTLNVVSYKLSVGQILHRAIPRLAYFSLGLNVEVTALQYVSVTQCVLLIGGKAIPVNFSPPRELHGKATWQLGFGVPEWVQPGTYKVCIGIPTPPTSYMEAWHLGPSLRDKYVAKSNEFEVTISESLVADFATLKAAAKAAQDAQAAAYAAARALQPPPNYAGGQMPGAH